MLAKSTVSKWLPVFLWAVVIFTFSSIKQVKVSEFFFWDFIIKKAAHVTEYAILYGFIFRATGKKYPLSFILTMLYAASDEYHQTFVLGRTGRFLDLGFDLSGANISAYIIWKLKHFLPHRPKK